MKKVSIFAVSLVLGVMVSCKETQESKITEADIQALEVQKALVGKLPKIELDKVEHDFGSIKDGDIVETEFIVKNTGEGDLIISNANASCGCTVPEYPKFPIKKGESAPIKVSFNSNGKVGQQSKTVTLTTNTEKGQETFTIKANVQPKPGKPVYQK